ncbi:hypothetical protein EX30DRAFT_344839 [Ascodesmis nigricans]|uniref:Uncharacterized protein n=1 Tax=Ascodesmis nigricans TaxID=341454 RepID=A0A4S2MPQ6_9PEZI|nr:hypothetical protein EX30DRAFT_344839 [Ascodesmis nigricans]
MVGRSLKLYVFDKQMEQNLRSEIHRAEKSLRDDMATLRSEITQAHTDVLKRQHNLSTELLRLD